MIVVDTSVAVQWFVPEQDHALAEQLLGRDDLVAPDALLLETANVLRKKLRDGLIRQDQAATSLVFLRARVNLVPFGDLLGRAFEMAVQIGHPVYDCTFLACAESVNGVVATRDSQLLSRASAAGYSKLVRLFASDWADELR